MLVSLDLTPEQAYKYARYVLEGPFPAGESAIAEHPHWAKSYVEFLSSNNIEVPALFKEYVK